MNVLKLTSFSLIFLSFVILIGGVSCSPDIGISELSGTWISQLAKDKMPTYQNKYIGACSEKNNVTLNYRLDVSYRYLFTYTIQDQWNNICLRLKGSIRFLKTEYDASIESGTVLILENLTQGYQSLDLKPDSRLAAFLVRDSHLYLGLYTPNGDNNFLVNDQTYGAIPWIQFLPNLRTNPNNVEKQFTRG